MQNTYLDQIASPADVKKLDVPQLQCLGAEVRRFLIENVSKTGGHLSSNLGTVELTLALHKVFTTPLDEIVWDVGHQCYTHKIITGRKHKFGGLRQLHGISGFPAPSESKHDVFLSGHGNTAISAAIGLATAKKLKGEQGKVIAIVGDGAFTGGMVYEGMNNIQTLSNLIVILNDNEMAISKNVGSVAQYFTKLRTSPRYFAVKRNVESALDAVPAVGRVLKRGIQWVKAILRRLLYHSTMFEEMGFQYVGPMDGHNLDELCSLFTAYRDDQSAPLFIHLLTIKGHGFSPAEENPGEFHGVSAFDVDHIPDPDNAPDSSFSTVFGTHLAELAQENTKLCAVTAAMKYGTGLQYFYKQHKERFFDVGMAEQHAVTFCAGLAAGGMQPVVAIYSTFLQRAYDQIIHDVNLQSLDLLLAVDRAGFVPGDGETHQGIYDAAFLSSLSGMTVVSPCNYAELLYWLDQLLARHDGPRALRYPRGAESERLSSLVCTGNDYDCYPAAALMREAARSTPELLAAYEQQLQVQKQKLCAFVTYGAEAEPVLNAQQQAAQDGVAVDVYKICVIHPLPQRLVSTLIRYDCVVFAEEGVGNGGIGEHLCTALLENGYCGVYRHVAAQSKGLTHASIDELREIYYLDAAALLAAMKEAMRENPA